MNSYFNPKAIGLEPFVRDRLAEVAGTEPKIFWRDAGPWCKAPSLEVAQRCNPAFVTSTWSAPDPDNDKRRVHLSSVIWLDLDAGELSQAIAAARETRSMLQGLGIDPRAGHLAASGGKGFHVAVPLALLVPGGVSAVGLLTVQHWPLLCKTFVYKALLTECLDFSLYSGGKGRMLRQANIQRENGQYKVPMAWGQLDGMTPEAYQQWCSEPRPPVEVEPVSGVAAGAAAVWAQAFREVCKPSKPSKPIKRRTPSDLTTGGKLRPQVLAKVEAALASLDVRSISYADWVRVGASLKSTGAADALKLWVGWSAPYRGFRARDCESRWEGLQGSCSLGTLYWLAANGGKA